MNKFERMFRPGSMVDEKEWQEFRADWIVFLIGAGIALCALFLLGLLGVSDAEFASRAEGVVNSVSCDGQLPGYAYRTPLC